MSRARIRIRISPAVAVLVVLLFVTQPLADHFEHRTPWVAALARIVFFVSIGALLVYGGLVMRAQKELERQIFLETSTIAFYVTVGAGLVLAALHEFHVLARPSPWIIWDVGWATWCGVRVALLRLRT
jgi:predicted tellurium resistance membrane protein TerC